MRKGWAKHKNCVGGILCVMMFVLGFTTYATGVRMRYDVVLKGGWNVIYLPVTPDELPDVFFADWPTDKVGCYDSESYNRTAQFTQTADDSTLGAITPHYKVWMRGFPVRTTLQTVLGDAIYVVNNTNTTDYITTIFGEPRAMRNVWHATSGGTVPVNYLGISTDGAAANLTENGYLMGLDTGWVSRWKASGRATLSQPSLKEITRDTYVSNGVAVAMDAARASDWSGPLFVSPALGIDLGSTGMMGVFKVRNDAGTNRTVRVSFSAGAMVKGVAAPTVPTLLYLDPVCHTAWQTNNLITTPYTRELVAGETLELRLAVNRETDIQGPVGTEYGGPQSPIPNYNLLIFNY